MPADSVITVWVPTAETVESPDSTFTERHRIAVSRFKFLKISTRKFTAQLKCQGFAAAVNKQISGRLLMLVDADTFCRCPFSLPDDVCEKVLGGRIALARDVIQRFSECHNNPRAPWYIAPEFRGTYVNSGVILCAKTSGDLFDIFRDTAGNPAFLRGRYNDQKIINYVMHTRFSGRLALLPVEYNGIYRRLNSRTIIGHIAGGAGRPHRKVRGRKVPRSELHEKLCLDILDKV